MTGTLRASLCPLQDGLLRLECRLLHGLHVGPTGKAACGGRIRERMMAGKIAIDPERCKGCGLCVKVCPRARIRMAKTSNRNGFFPAEADPKDCTGCAQCAVVCPEAAVKVYRKSAVTEVKSGRRPRKAAGVVKERS